VWGNLGDGWVEITYDPTADACVDGMRSSWPRSATSGITSVPGWLASCATRWRWR